MLRFLRRLPRFGNNKRERGIPRPVRPHLEQLEDRLVLTIALPPTGLVATGISSSSIALQWNASTDPSVTGYDVYEKVWINGSHGGKGSGGGGHYAYNLVSGNLTTNTDTISGLASGSSHIYLVTAINSSGQSLYSLPATAETWIAPSQPYGSEFVLSSGAVWSGVVNATVGQTTQIYLLTAGNPLTYSLVSPVAGASVNPKDGVVTFTPTANEVGTVNVDVKSSNALGSVTQTIQFNVAAANPSLATPTLKLTSTSSTYNGQYQSVGVVAVGTDGVTPISGSATVAYNGGTTGLLKVGTYQVLVTFTSNDPNYNNATLLTTFTIHKATPKFSYLSAPQTIAVGSTPTVFTGYLSSGTAVPVGDYVIVTLNGVSEAASVDHNGIFTASFDTSALALGTYTVSYAFAGDSNYNAAANGHSTLKVVPTAPPVVTQNPSNQIVSAPDGVSFTAKASGEPVPTVQWQVSTDGGVTWTDITGNTSAQTDTFTILSTSSNMNGYQYRAVFTNAVGTATTKAATLTIEGD